MKRFLLVLCWLLLVVFWAQVVLGQDAVPLEVKGDVSVVKVDKVVVIQEDRTVVKSVPFKVAAPSGGGIYTWTVTPSAGVQFIDKNDTLEISACPKGSITISVKMIGANLDKDGKFIGFLVRFGSVTFDVGEVGPQPKPEPKPDPKPDPKPEPKPDPAPFPANGLHVLIAYETANINPRLANMIASGDLIKYLKGACAKEPGNGWSAYRIWDKDVFTGNEAKTWQDAMKKVTGKPVPYIVISNGVTGFEGPLPDSVEGIIELVKKYAGVKK